MTIRGRSREMGVARDLAFPISREEAISRRMLVSGRLTLPETNLRLDESLGSQHIRWVASKLNNTSHGSVGAWAKRYYFASRTVIEAVLRPYDLGTTQWYVLYQLANEGATAQRELQRILQIDRGTMSTIVATLVRKEFVQQVADRHDQRQRVLHLTATGGELWSKLPDPIAVVHSVAFEGVDETELTSAAELLEAAAQRLNNHGLTE